jgi:hypothetical protein
MTTRWVFEERKKKDKKRDPMEAEFFTGDEDEDDVSGRTDGLVRESIQNSLDARRDDSKVVTVRFAIGAVPISSDLTATYLDGLVEHLKVLENETVNGHVPKMSYLIVEDFGTRGLCGDPAQYEDPSGGGSGYYDYYWFWRNVGRSGKTGGDRGRWGVGKTVFPSCSTINSMYGLTVQADSHRKLLMGQAVLKTHKLRATEYAPDGWFCDPAKSEDLQMPFEDAAFVARFEASFDLKRGTEPGTSIVVPYPIAKLKASSILQSVVVHYFTQIVRGLLVVHVEGPDLQAMVLDAGNIETLACSMKWEGKRGEKKHATPPIALARLAHRQVADGNLVTMQRQSAAPTWSEGQSLLDAKDLSSLREAFDLGSPVAIRVPVDIVFNDKYFRQLAAHSPATQRQRWSHFDVFMQRRKDPGGSPRGEDYFVRGGMTITGISTIPQSRGVTALLLVDDESLTSFLGDAENPAHTDWKEGEEALKKKYDKYHSRIRFVRHAIDKLLGILAMPKAGMNKQAFIEFFPIEIPTAGAANKRTKPKMPKLPPPVPKAFAVRPLQGGFVVSGHPTPHAVMPNELEVTAAYELDGATRRAAFRYYDRKDFAFDGRALSIKVERCDIKSAQDNVITLDNLHSDFELRVTGFAETLDVVVRAVDPIKKHAPEDADDESPDASQQGSADGGQS